MAKKVVGKIGLQIPAGKATPAPPIGPALGPYSLNIMDFCKQYNERTASQAGMIIPVEITVYEDRTFTFITKTPPASFLIKQALKIESGSKEPNRNKVGKLTNAQARRYCQSEDARHQRERHRCSEEDHRGYGALDGRGGGSIMARFHGKRFLNISGTYDRKQLSTQAKPSRS